MLCDPLVYHPSTDDLSRFIPPFLVQVSARFTLGMVVTSSEWSVYWTGLVVSSHLIFQDVANGLDDFGSCKLTGLDFVHVRTVKIEAVDSETRSISQACVFSRSMRRFLISFPNGERVAFFTISPPFFCDRFGIDFYANV